MSTYNTQPGYGAVPPGAVGSSPLTMGHAYTTNNTSGLWNAISGTAPVTHAIQIGNPAIITFGVDGTITTKAGTISAEEWISVIKVMKQLIIDMSKDKELASKYPYIQDAAHSWFMQELKGREE
jgi:hypothetical protein